MVIYDTPFFIATEEGAKQGPFHWRIISIEPDNARTEIGSIIKISEFFDNVFFSWVNFNSWNIAFWLGKSGNYFQSVVDFPLEVLRKLLNIWIM